MATILNQKSLYYNDVNLIARKGVIESRKDIPKERWRIFASPMPAVVGKTFAQKAAEAGISVCLHRFCKPEDQLDIYNSIEDKMDVYMSCGLKDDFGNYQAIKAARCQQVVVDFANGYLPNIEKHLEKIHSIINIKKLIVGNVHTIEGVQYLESIFQNLGIKEGHIRVGIAGGGPCATSDVTGINRGNITEIIECSQGNIPIIADGGIHKAGFAAKAFAAGADAVFLGKYFMQCLEAESNLNGDGSYWGCASHKNQENWKGKAFRHSEGKEISLEKNNLQSLEKTVEELWGGISSYVSYAGYPTLTSAIGNGIFEIKQNSLPPKSRI